MFGGFLTFLADVWLMSRSCCGGRDAWAAVKAQPEGIQFAFKIMNFALKMMNSTLKMMNLALKMMDFVKDAPKGKGKGKAAKIRGISQAAKKAAGEDDDDSAAADGDDTGRATRAQVRLLRRLSAIFQPSLSLLCLCLCLSLPLSLSLSLSLSLIEPSLLLAGGRGCEQPVRG